MLSSQPFARLHSAGRVASPISRTQLLELERREEAMIAHAAAEGVEVLRRPDTSPAAVLGVVIVKAQVLPGAAAAP